MSEFLYCSIANDPMTFSPNFVNILYTVCIILVDSLLCLVVFHVNIEPKMFNPFLAVLSSICLVCLEVQTFQHFVSFTFLKYSVNVECKELVRHLFHSGYTHLSQHGAFW